MSFINDIENKGAAHLLTDRDIRDIAVKNIWKGIMIVEKTHNFRMRWHDKVAIIGDICIAHNEPIGSKAIEKIIEGIRLDEVDFSKYKKESQTKI